MTRGRHAWAGATLLFVAVALAILITIHPHGLKAPAWVAYLATGVLALAGGVALARAAGRPRLAEGLVACVLAGLLVTGVWITFGAGPRSCVRRLPGTGVVVSILEEPTCRSIFGIGSGVVAGMLVFALRRCCRRPRR